ncbi:MAG: DUF177 domain-containing protein [Gammaproteobacteria bacterium]|nr:DUF177 domain-containing protein [Gammaproteobacteria bacterium]
MLIDPFRFARTGEQLVTNISLLPEGRLQGVIADKSDITLDLTGSRNEYKRFMLEGHISGFVSVQCQVCLENLQMPLDINFRLFPVISEEQAERLQQEFEPIVIEDNSLALEELVTNELILSLPVAISHIEIDMKDCANRDNFSAGNLEKERQEEKKSSPFAKLESLKTTKQKDS